MAASIVKKMMCYLPFDKQSFVIIFQSFLGIFKGVSLRDLSDHLGLVTYVAQANLQRFSVPFKSLYCFRYCERMVPVLVVSSNCYSRNVICIKKIALSTLSFLESLN